MHILLHRLELLVDRIIPPLLLVLFFGIIAEIFFHDRFSAYFDYLDALVIAVFATDLAFKFHRVKKVPKFLRMYWLEIIATTPFFLVFRLSEFIGLQEIVERGQHIAHEAPEISRLEREGAAIAREASRTSRMIRSFRILSRLPRFLRAMPFFQEPTGKHHWYEEKKNRLN